jgi:hypothetical protein
MGADRPRRRPGRPEAEASGMGRRRGPATLDVAALYDPAKQRTPEQIVAHFSDLLLAAPLDPARRDELVTHLKSAGGDPEAQMRGLIHLLMSTPNYQLC